MVVFQIQLTRTIFPYRCLLANILQTLLLLTKVLLLAQLRRFVWHLSLLGVHDIHEHTHFLDTFPFDAKLLYGFVEFRAPHQTWTNDPVLRQLWNVKLLLHLYLSTQCM